MIKKIGRWTLILLHILISIPTFLALISPLISPGGFYWPSICALILPFFLLTQIAFLIYWIITWDWPAFLSLALLLPAIPAIDRYVQIGSSAQVQDKAAIQILSYNTHHFYELSLLDKEEQNLAPEAWKEFSRSVDDFDILALQEYRKKTDEFFDKVGDYPYSTHCDIRRSLRILSMYPIVQSGCIDLIEGSKNQAIWTDILLPKGKSINGRDTIRIYNIHLASNRISGISKKMFKEMDLNPEQVYSKARLMFALYKHHAPERIVELKEILNHIRTSPYPLVLCGDFNETPQTRVYRLATEELEDAFLDKGSGMGATYGGYIPFLRIDYILYSDAFEVLSFKKASDIQFSDHYPITATLKLKSAN